MKFLVTVDRDEDGVWVAECPAIPGCVSQGSTREEAAESIREAIVLCLEARRKGPASHQRDPADRSGHVDATASGFERPRGRAGLCCQDSTAPVKSDRLAVRRRSSVRGRGSPCRGRSARVSEGGELMLRTIKALIEADGTIRLLEPVSLGSPRQALLTILDDDEDVALSSAVLSEAALAADWSRPEEDAAWAHLQRAR